MFKIEQDAGLGDRSREERYPQVHHTQARNSAHSCCSQEVCADRKNNNMSEAASM